MWSIIVEVLRVVLIGLFISCLKPYVEQNSAYFLMSGGSSLQNCLNWSGLLKIYFPLKRNHPGVFIVNFEVIPYLVLGFLFSPCTLWACICLLCVMNFFYISIVFRFDGFRFHLFLEIISTKKNVSTKWNAQEVDLEQWNAKCISIQFLWWNLNYELTSTINNELHTFQISNAFFSLNSVLFNFFVNWVSNVA